MEKTPLNPWLIDLVKEFSAAHPGAELRELYERSLEAHPGISWKQFLVDAAIQARVQEQVHAVYYDGPTDFEKWAHRITDIYEEMGRQLREAGVEPETLRRFLREEVEYVNGQVTEYKDLTDTVVRAVEEYVALTESLYGCEGLEAAEAWNLRAETFFMAERFADAQDLYRHLIGFLEARPNLSPLMLANARDTAGVCLMVLGRNDEAIGLLLKAFSFFEKEPEKNRSKLWFLSSTIAEVYYRLGDHDKMLAFYDIGDQYNDNPIPHS